MLRAARFALLALTAFLLIGAATASAQPRMPIGFFDDPTFRWSADRMDNLQRASVDGASIIHTTASWAALAPTRRPTRRTATTPHTSSPTSTSSCAARPYGMRVMINITGTPKWANGNQKPNVMPKKIGDLTTFAHMLAARYNGTAGQGLRRSLVGVERAEPAAVPDAAVRRQEDRQRRATTRSSTRPRTPASSRGTDCAGRDRRDVGAGPRQAVGRRAARRCRRGCSRSCSRSRRACKFDAWAHHPYPTAPGAKPTEKVRYPNVTLSTMPKFETDLHTWFKRPCRSGSPSTATRRSPASRTASRWRRRRRTRSRRSRSRRRTRTCRCSSGSRSATAPATRGRAACCSPRARRSRRTRPSARSRARPTGTTVNVRAGRAPTLTLYFPVLAFYNSAGTICGMTYTDLRRQKPVAVAQPAEPLRANQSLVFPVSFTPVKKHTYTVTVTANDPNGHTETVVAQLKAI